MLNIKDISGNILLSTPINDGCKRKFTLMKEDYINIKFSLANPIYFKIGSYVDCDFGRFEVCDIQKPTYNIETSGYDYELRLDAYYWRWKNKIFKYIPETSGQEAAWSLTASLDVQASIVIRNLQSLGYKYNGQDFTFSIDNTVDNKAQLMSYNNINIIDACFSMAEKWSCECWITDNVIHFGRCEIGDTVDFKIGVNVEDMSRSDSQTSYATRIYAFGSTRNIPPNYRPADNSMLINGVVQKRLMLPVGVPYIDAYPDMSTEESIEQVVVFDNIYPSRVGTITNVSSYEHSVKNDDGTTTTETFYRFTDTGINFSKDYLLDGSELRIVFQSGLLNGMDFAVKFNPNAVSEKHGNGNWNPEAQLYEIIVNEDYGRKLPDTILKPKIGDKYILHGFDSTKIGNMGYVSSAEEELKREAEKYVAKSKIDPSTYDCRMMSDTMMKDGNPELYEIGQRVNLLNPAYFENGRVSRIIGFEYNLDIPFDTPIYTVGETAAYSRIKELENKVEELVYKGQIYAAGKSGVYLITSFDRTTPSENNTFSARRSLKEFLSKTKSDRTEHSLEVGQDLTVDGDGTVGQDLTVGRDASVGKDLTVKGLFKALKNMLVGGDVTADGNVTAGKKVKGGDVEANETVSGKNIKAEEEVTAKKVTSLDAVIKVLATIHNLTVEESADIMHGIIREYISSNKFVSGFLGEGFKIWKDASGLWCGELDMLTVRKVFTVFALVVQKVVHQGGMVIRSAAGGKITKVTDGGSFWKCEHDSTDDFSKDDQILCQVFTGTKMKRYWRLVTSAGAGFFNLSKSDCEAGSATPEVSDDVAVLGNRTNPARQSAQIDCAVGANAPYRDDYAGINSYSLAGKLVTRTGNLSGIVDPDFGALSGYGLYSLNTFLKGQFRLASGKSVEAAIGDAVDGMQVGGRNYVILSRLQTYLQNTSTPVVIGTDITVSLRLENTTNQILSLRVKDFIPEDGITYTISGYMTLAGRPIKDEDFRVKKICQWLPVQRFRVDDATGYFECTQVYGNGTPWMLGVALTANTGDIVKISKLKFEKGTKATDWSPSPEDVEAGIDALITGVRTDFDIREGQISSKVQEVTVKAQQAGAAAVAAQNSAQAAGVALQNVSTKQTQVNQTAAEVEQKASRAEQAAGKAEAAEARINTTADGVVVQAAKQAVEGLDIGGRNYVILSRLQTYWQNTSTPVVTGTDITVSLRFENTTNQVLSLRVKDFIPEAGVTYTFSGFLTLNGRPIKDADFRIKKTSKQATVQRFRVDDTTGYFECTHTYDGVNPWMFDAALTANTGAVVKMSKLKFEKGVKATDWSPAPEDQEADAAAKYTTKTENDAKLSVLNTKIEGKVSQEEFDAYGNRLKAAESGLKAESEKLRIYSQKTDNLSGRMDAAELELTPGRIWQGIKNKAQEQVDGVKSALLATGIDIVSKMITVTAPKFKVQHNNGTPIAVFELDTNGNPVLRAEMIAAGCITAEKIAARAITAAELNVESVQAAVVTADRIAAMDITTGKLTVTSGARIAGFRVSGNSLTNVNSAGQFIDDATIVFRNDEKSCFAGIGGNVLPVSTGARAVARFENNDTTNSWGLTSNYACILSAKNGVENYALYMMSGCIGGMAVKVRQINSDTTLEHSDCWVSCYNTGTITVNLPSNPERGKMIYIMRVNHAHINVNGNGKQIHYGGILHDTAGIRNDGEIDFYLYDGQFWMNGWFNY